MLPQTGIQENSNFLLEDVEMKEPRGMQVETQTTEKNGCGPGRGHEFLKVRETHE